MMAFLLWLLRILFGLVFIYAGSIKIFDPASFAEAVANYQILPTGLVNPAAVFIPWIELLCGAGLALGVLARGAALILNMLMTVFTAAVGYNWWRGLDIDCGCFGDVAGLTSGMAAATYRDAALLLIGVVILWRVCNTSKRRYLYK